MTSITMPLADLLRHLEKLVVESLRLWDLPIDAKVRLINVSENVTYLIEATDGYKAVLRVHREDYHSEHAIECELEWISALDQSGVVAVPRPIKGVNGKFIQLGSIEGLTNPRFMVLFEFIEGSAPDEKGDLAPGFEELGAIAARTHLHSIAWEKSQRFERLRWDLDEIFGSSPTWGDWRNAPGITADIQNILEKVEATIKSRLEVFGREPERYGLIHADMRLANLLVSNGKTRLIDFDDCGIGWFLYDFAAGISFMEDDPRVPALKAAWLRGYRSVRSLTQEDEAEIDTFVMLRRMALLAWIGSHIEAPEPQALASDFAMRTAKLGEDWLSHIGK